MTIIRLVGHVIIALSLTQLAQSQLNEGTCPPILDVIILFDTSGSLATLYEQEKNWTIEISRTLPIHEEAVRVGMIQYADEAKTEFNLSTFSERTDIIDFLDGINYLNGSAKSGKALRRAEEDIFNFEQGARLNAQRLVIIFTDGLSMDNPAKAAKILRRRGVRIFAISVNSIGFVPEMLAIVGDSENIFGPADEERLKDRLLIEVERSRWCDTETTRQLKKSSFFWKPSEFIPDTSFDASFNSDPEQGSIFHEDEKRTSNETKSREKFVGILNILDNSTETTVEKLVSNINQTVNSRIDLILDKTNNSQVILPLKKNKIEQNDEEGFKSENEEKFNENRDVKVIKIKKALTSEELSDELKKLEKGLTTTTLLQENQTVVETVSHSSSSENVTISTTTTPTTTPCKHDTEIAELIEAEFEKNKEQLAENFKRETEAVNEKVADKNEKTKKNRSLTDSTIKVLTTTPTVKTTTVKRAAESTIKSKSNETSFNRRGTTTSFVKFETGGSKKTEKPLKNLIFEATTTPSSIFNTSSTFTTKNPPSITTSLPIWSTIEAVTRFPTLLPLRKDLLLVTTPTATKKPELKHRKKVRRIIKRRRNILSKNDKLKKKNQLKTGTETRKTTPSLQNRLFGTTIKPVTANIEPSVEVNGVQCPMDILFIVDSSGSIGHNYDDQKEFLTRLMKKVEPTRSHRVGLIQFAGPHLQKMEWSFDTHSKSSQLLSAIRNVRHLTGTTYIGAALKLSLTLLETRRKHIETTVILISDGFSQDDSTQQAKALQQLPNVKTYAVSLNKLTNTKYLMDIVGDRKNVFVNDESQSFEDFFTNKLSCISRKK